MRNRKVSVHVQCSRKSPAQPLEAIWPREMCGLGVDSVKTVHTGNSTDMWRKTGHFLSFMGFPWLQANEDTKTVGIHTFKLNMTPTFCGWWLPSDCHFATLESNPAMKKSSAVTCSNITRKPNGACFNVSAANRPCMCAEYALFSSGGSRASVRGGVPLGHLHYYYLQARKRSAVVFLFSSRDKQSLVRVGWQFSAMEVAETSRKLHTALFCTHLLLTMVSCAEAICHCCRGADRALDVKIPLPSLKISSLYTF